MSGTFTSEALRLAAWVRRFDERAEQTARAIADAELTDARSQLAAGSAEGAALAARLAESQGEAATLSNQLAARDSRVAELDAEASQLRAEMQRASERALAFRTEAGQQLDRAFSHLQGFVFDQAAQALAKTSDALVVADWMLRLKQLTAVAHLAEEGIALHARLASIVDLVQGVRATAVDGLLDNDVDEFARGLARASGSRLAAAYTIAHQLSDLPDPATDALRDNFIRLGQALHTGWQAGFATVNIDEIKEPVSELARVILQEIPSITRSASTKGPEQFVSGRKRPRSEPTASTEF